MKTFFGEHMNIVLDNGEIVNSTLPLPKGMSLDQIKEALDKYNERDSKDWILESWKRMKERCHGNSIQSNKNYKDKGISICQDWLYSFENFYMWSIEHGHQPGYVIDRIDPTGNYTPMNCQWISRSENSSRQKYNYFYKEDCQS
jgi:hypothetical protein